MASLQIIPTGFQSLQNNPGDLPPGAYLCSTLIFIHWLKLKLETVLRHIAIDLPLHSCNWNVWLVAISKTEDQARSEKGLIAGHSERKIGSFSLQPPAGRYFIALGACPRV